MLRKVKYYREPKGKRTGWFHQFGTEMEYTDGVAGIVTVAIVEDAEDGEVYVVPPGAVTFLDKPEEEPKKMDSRYPKIN